MFDNIAPKYDLNHTLSMSTTARGAAAWSARCAAQARPHPGRGDRNGRPGDRSTWPAASATTRCSRTFRSRCARRGTPRKIGGRWTGAIVPSTAMPSVSRRGRRACRSRCGDRSAFGAQLPETSAGLTGGTMKTRGQSSRRSWSFRVPANRVFLGVGGRILFPQQSLPTHRRAGVAATSSLRVASGTVVSRAGGVHGDDGGRDFANCRARSQSFGIAQIYIGER